MIFHTHNKHTKEMSTQHDENEMDEVMPAIDTAFSVLLNQQRGGKCLTELSRLMREAIAASQELGKPAVLTLKIAVKPAANGSNAVVVADKIKVTLPEPKPQTSFFFSDANGNLHRNDPNQRELPLRAVTGGKAVEVETLRRASAQ